jgi:hypothetical protein
MKFGRRYSKVTVLMAMLHGVLIGVAGVAVIGLLLIGMKGKDGSVAGSEEVPTAGPAPAEVSAPDVEKPVRLFAKQHGVFTSADAASQFIAEDPSLAKAAVMQVGDQYYVWTAVGLQESDIDPSESEGTFRKAFTAELAACGADGAGKLWEVLNGTEMSQIKNLATAQDGESDDEKVKEFKKNITAITAFSDDLHVVKLHLLSHYSSPDNCVKILF